MGKGSEFAQVQGIWRSHGYGNLLEIGKRRYKLFEETAVSCLPVSEGALEELDEFYLDIRLSPRKQAFSAQRAAGVTRIRFRRLKAIPEKCAEMAPDIRRDPEYNFEVFWHAFAEHYALFELKGVDWQAMYSRFRPLVDARTAPARLFEIFSEMLRPLRDGHVRLHSHGRHFSAGDAKPLHDRIAAELDRADDARDLWDYIAERREWLRDLIRETYLEGRSRRSRSGHLEWGQLDGDTGYLTIRAMAGLSGKSGHPHEDIQAVDEIMPGVMADLSGLQNLVVDVRGNGGGYDPVALRLAGYLIDRKRLAFTKSARRGAGHTRRQPVYVEPSGSGRYRGNLVVLTSGLTASAAEIFVLALLQHPRLTLIGEATDGILSDTMERHLPNGWFLTLSNEIYYAFDGELYEDSGIPPHIEIPYLDRRGRNAGRDPMLDYVLKNGA